MSRDNCKCGCEDHCPVPVNLTSQDWRRCYEGAASDLLSAKMELEVVKADLAWVTAERDEAYRALPANTAREGYTLAECVTSLGAAIQRKDEALRRIAALDYANAATNGAAYDAVSIASAALSSPVSQTEGEAEDGAEVVKNNLRAFIKGARDGLRNQDSVTSKRVGAFIDSLEIIMDLREVSP